MAVRASQEPSSADRQAHTNIMRCKSFLQPLDCAEPVETLALASMTVSAVQAAGPAQGAAHVVEMVLPQMHRQQGQISVCWTLYCKNSGIILQTDTLALLSSNLTAVEKSGGIVTNVQMATCTAGLLLLLTEAMAGVVHSAQAGNCASTAHWPPRIPRLLQSGTQLTIAPAQKMSWPQAASQASGSVDSAATYGLHASIIGLLWELDAPNAASAILSMQGSGIPL